MTDPAPSDLIGRVDLSGPGILGLFAQGVLTGLLIAQFSTFLDRMECNSLGLVAMAAFVTVVALFQSSIFIVAVWRNDVLHKYSLTWIEPTQPIFTSLMSAPVQAYLIWRFWPILRCRRSTIGPLFLLLVLSISGKIALTIKILEAKSHGILANIHSNARFDVYPFFLCAVVPPAILDIVITSIRIYHLRNLLKQVHSERIRKRIIRLIVIGWQAAVPPTVCTFAYVVTYLLFTNLWPGKGDYWFIAIESILGKLYVISFFFILNNRVSFSNDSTASYIPTLTGALGEPGQGTFGGHQDMPMHCPFPVFTRQHHSSAGVSAVIVDATQK
ncbi:hypothetical protein EI94DRAFT_1800345 [Lactarius quietus]|nr:hypothetical protein EI94DRAFT_1800345 [Lactarius quietus]